MKILMFTNTFFPTTGGAEFVIHHVSQELVQRGHEVTVLAPQEKGEMPDGWQADYTVKRYRRPLSKRFGVRQLLVPLLMEHWQSGMDILHCHNAYPAGYVALSFKTITRHIPFLITCHGTDIMASERLRQNPRLDARIRRAVKGADRVTSIGSSMKGEITAAGVAEDRICNIPNGVDWHSFQGNQKTTTDPDSAPFIFSLGGFRKRKGFDVLLRAMAIVSEKNSDLKLLLAGDGIERETLENVCRELKLQDRVQFLGIVHGDRKRELFQSCEFFVCPSRWEEPFGLINLEAMASGKAVIASRVGSIPDVVVDGETGVLVDKEDPEQLAQAILQRLEVPAETKSMGERGRQRAREYDWPKIVDQYEALYAEMTAAHYV